MVVIASVGDTLVEGSVMLRVYGGKQVVDEGALVDAFALGSERTFEQDPKYIIRLLVDIAIKALSPAVNDPRVRSLHLSRGVSLYPPSMVHGRSGAAGSDRLRATMPSPPVHTAALTCHPGIRSHAVRGVRARVEPDADGMLALAYSLEGELARLRVPPPGRPRIAERLWQHTCCEVFIARAGQPAYHEFNLAPSGEWAAYAFARYRDGALLADEELDPRIAVRSSADGLALEASISLRPAVSGARPRAACARALGRRRGRCRRPLLLGAEASARQAGFPPSRRVRPGAR